MVWKQKRSTHTHACTHTHAHTRATHTNFYPSPYHSLSSRCEDGSEGIQDNPDWCWSGRSWRRSQPHQPHVPEFPADCTPAAGPGAGNPEARLGECQLRSHGCGPERRQEHCWRLLDQGRRGLMFPWCWMLDHWRCAVCLCPVREVTGAAVSEDSKAVLYRCRLVFPWCWVLDHCVLSVSVKTVTGAAVEALQVQAGLSLVLGVGPLCAVWLCQWGK